ncbi:hypothetical protein [Brevibacillus dissolubilis]|uniref:hypothetical protein n=1 Tax=Brevibacillus dissolubilis TaxID=1844116 RepID=UPI001117390C|nr:hypothetical protein [Brevibacillus dissolubilis]
MPVLLLSLFLLVLELQIGLTVMDTDLISQKQTVMQELLDNALHHASFGVEEESLKRTGAFFDISSQALIRLHERMGQNGGYTWNGLAYQPGQGSVTNSVVPAAFVQLDEWEATTELTFRYTGGELRLASHTQTWSDSPLLFIRIVDDTNGGKVYKLPPKVITGSLLVAVAMVDDEPISNLFARHTFPVVSVQEIQH